MPTPNRSLDLTYLASPSTSTPAPSTPAEHSYGAAESGLAELRGVGFDDGGRTVDVLVALTHGTLAIAGILAQEDEHSRRLGQPRRCLRSGSSGAGRYLLRPARPHFRPAIFF